MNMEGNPQERHNTEKEGHIPGISENTYEAKVAKLRALESEIKLDKELEQKIRVDQTRGVTPEIAKKMLADTIKRLVKHEAEYNKMMGINVQ